MELLKLYEQGGFEIDEEFRELPDHVAVELEFLYLLTYQQNQAQAGGDAEALQAVQVLRTAFLDGHLGRWLGGFILAVHDHAQTDFYRELAELTELFVRLEGQRPGYGDAALTGDSRRAWFAEHDTTEHVQPMHQSTVHVACLCAGWCHLCDDYRAVLRCRGRRNGLPARRICSWHWIDIEDEADLVGEVDVETFPTLVIAEGTTVRFAGPLTPHPDTLRRLLRATVVDEPGAGRWPTVSGEFQAFAARLGLRAKGAP